MAGNRAYILGKNCSPLRHKKRNSQDWQVKREEKGQSPCHHRSGSPRGRVKQQAEGQSEWKHPHTLAGQILYLRGGGNPEMSDGVRRNSVSRVMSAVNCASW